MTDLVTGLWIRSVADHGGALGVIRQARAIGCDRVVVQGGEGDSLWPQLNPVLVKHLQEAGLAVYGWAEHPTPALERLIRATGVDGYAAPVRLGAATAALRFARQKVARLDHPEAASILRDLDAIGRALNLQENAT